jgi:hypothetical protein
MKRDKRFVGTSGWTCDDGQEASVATLDAAAAL